MRAFLVFSLSTLLGLLVGCRPPVSPPPPDWPDAGELWHGWQSERVVTSEVGCLGYEELVERLRALHESHPQASEIEQVGFSYEGRAIHLLTLGSGPVEILLWSQMHGDEPSATPALLDVASYLLDHADEPMPSALLER